MAFKGKPDARILAIDPGEEHVGMAEFGRTDNVWRCIHVWESLPGPALEFVQGNLPLLGAVVYEGWQIYPDMAATLIGSPCETAQFIGALKWIVLGFNKSAATFPDLPPPGLVDFVEQPAAIQDGTRGLLKVAKVKSLAKRLQAGDHALSAELHGWCYLHRTGISVLA